MLSRTEIRILLLMSILLCLPCSACGDNEPAQRDAGADTQVHIRGPGRTPTQHGVPVLYWDAGSGQVFETEECGWTFTAPDGAEFPAQLCWSSDGSGIREYEWVLLSVNGAPVEAYCTSICLE